MGLAAMAAAVRQSWIPLIPKPPMTLLTPRRLGILLPFAAGYFFSYLLRNANAVITPELTRELGLGAAGLGLLTSVYWLAFAAAQLPLGILLDRCGPRRVNGTLLVLACLGCAGFALGHSLGTLLLARALIGLGVSACLMAAFKALAQTFEARHLPAVNAGLMASGGLGALVASRPINQLAQLLGWRGMFLGVAGFGCLLALAVWRTPELPGAASRESLRDQVQGLGRILTHPAFWRYAPLTLFANGGFMALQGLWVVPWLIQVNGLSRDAAARQLLLVSVAMILGFLGISALAGRLARLGLPPAALYRWGMGFGILALGLIIGRAAPPQALWMALGLGFAVSNLAYALLSANFPVHLAGRVNTALNLAAILGAFLLQGAIGLLVDAGGAAGLAPADAYRAAFALLLGMQACGYAWFLWSERREAAREPALP